MKESPPRETSAIINSSAVPQGNRAKPDSITEAVRTVLQKMERVAGVGRFPWELNGRLDSGDRQDWDKVYLVLPLGCQGRRWGRGTVLTERRVATFPRCPQPVGCPNYPSLFPFSSPFHPPHT